MWVTLCALSKNDAYFIVRVGAKDYLLETPKMGAVPARILKKPVSSLSKEQAQIIAALDFLFQGY